MGNKSRGVIFFLLFILFFSACQSATPTQTAGLQPSATPTSPSATSAPEEFCKGAEPEAQVDERPGHVYIDALDEIAGYAYREVLQLPVGMAWGPDGRLYVGDWLGRDVVAVEPGGKLVPLKLWESNQAIGGDGPRGVAFDSQGCLYINNHGNIFQVDIASGYQKRIDGIQGAPVGRIAIGPGDELYYTDRSQEGAIKKWVPPASSEVVATGLPGAEALAFDQAGNLYVTQLGVGDVKKVDIATGETRLFKSGICGFDPCFLAVDAEGDLWVRAAFTLTQLGPDASLKPYRIDGVLFDGVSEIWHTAAGIAFDNEGGLYISSYNSYLKRLAPVASQDSIPSFTLTEVSPGFEASDLAVDSSGNLYAPNENETQLVKITTDGEVEVLWDYEWRGRVAVAVSPQDVVFIALPNGQLVRIDKDGSRTVIAQLIARRMVFAEDGMLYAVVGNYGQEHKIVRVDENGNQTTVATEIAGIPLGRGEAHISPAKDTGLYVFTERERNLFYLAFDGQGTLITNLAPLGGGGPVVMAASPSGEIYYISHGPYQLVRIGLDGEPKLIASNLSGDPWGMVVSADGKWLYVAESGAIDKVPIP